jgi:hypothetical protein
MQMVHIARQQLAAQERVRNDILKSTIAGAQIIACEMERQTQALDGAIQRRGRSYNYDILLFSCSFRQPPQWALSLFQLPIGAARHPVHHFRHSRVLDLGPSTHSTRL